MLTCKDMSPWDEGIQWVSIQGSCAYSTNLGLRIIGFTLWCLCTRLCLHSANTRPTAASPSGHTPLPPVLVAASGGGNCDPLWLLAVCLWCFAACLHHPTACDSHDGVLTKLQSGRPPVAHTALVEQITAARRLESSGLCSCKQREVPTRRGRGPRPAHADKSQQAQTVRLGLQA